MGLNPPHLNLMNGHQIMEDQINELLLHGTVRVHKCAHSLGVLGPTVACDEYFGHLVSSYLMRV